MALNNGEAATAPKDSLKRKMKEVVEAAAEPPLQPAANFLTIQRPQFPSHISTALHLNINGHISQPSGLVGQSSQETPHIGQPLPSMQSQSIHVGQSSQPAQSQVMLELSKPVKSSTSLLTVDDDMDDINAIIKQHGEQLRRTFTEMSWKHYNTLALAVEQKAAKKLKEKEMQLNNMMIQNAELQQMAANFKQEAQAAKARVKSLENAVGAMNVAMNEGNVRAGGNNMNGLGLQYKNVESSFTDPDRGVEPIKLACKACHKQVANMTLWPCYHVALCTKCDAIAKVCPVCGSAKTMSIELGQP